MKDYFAPMSNPDPSNREVANHYFEKALEVAQDNEAFGRLGTRVVQVWLDLADIALRLED